MDYAGLPREGEWPYLQTVPWVLVQYGKRPSHLFLP